MRSCPDPEDVDLDAVDLFDPALYSDGDPHPIWRALRLRAPVHWQGLDDGRGFWSVTRHADAARVLREHGLFTSEAGNLLFTLGDGDPASGKMMTSTDPPRHTALREPLNRALSAGALAPRAPGMRRAVRRFLLPLLDGGPWDLARAGLTLPMAFTGPLLGVPESDWVPLAAAGIAATAPDDTAFGPDAEATLAGAHYELFEYFSTLVRERGAAGHDGDDLIGCLMSTRVDGAPLAHDEVVYNCYSLLLGASVTAPHVVAGTVAALIPRPEVHDAVAADPALVPGAVEEALRWTSPANHFLRHAVEDTTLGGVEVLAGDAVVAWIGSANRDEDVFPDPDRFDPARSPNRHLALGFGRHYCVGAPLARLALGLVLGELLRLVERFEPAGPAERLRSNFVAGLKRLPVTARLRPGAAAALRAEDPGPRLPGFE